MPALTDDVIRNLVEAEDYKPMSVGGIIFLTLTLKSSRPYGKYVSADYARTGQETEADAVTKARKMAYDKIRNLDLVFKGSNNL
jgi:hypothetical protein